MTIRIIDTCRNKRANGVLQLARDYGVDTKVIYKVLRGTYPK